jgi:UDP-N-acetylmuramate dehydrogenase
MPVSDPDARAAAAAALGELAQHGVSLAPLTTYKVGGAADLFVRAESIEDLTKVAAAQAASGLPVLMVGRGSNLLVADRGFGGIAVVLGDFATNVAIDDERSIVEAGSSVLLPVLARQMASVGLSGFEWAVGVPGSIGGAVRMNAGGHGSDMSESLIDVRVFDLAGGGERLVSASELGLRFRGSGMGSSVVVLSARLQLRAGDPERGRAELSDIVAWRRANQPGGQNAGSVFVNPVPHQVSAGKLIDDLGLRGFRHGSASVSDKHANFIQADPDGSADDVHALMAIVREQVESNTDYELRSEIRLIGFDA